MAMWEEVAIAAKEGRRELVLTGKAVQERVGKDGLDQKIFSLKLLNFLEVSHAGLVSLPVEVANLTNLTSLVLKGNQMNSLPPLDSLTSLKLLDVSLNQLTTLPDMSSLASLETLNLSLNKLDGELGPDAKLQGCTKLAVLEVTGNSLIGLGELQDSKMEYLAVVAASKNSISSLSPSVSSNWPALKKLDLASNRLSEVPGELGDCIKLKELSLVENPLSDTRLKKMAAQKGTKSVLDYIRANCPKAGGGGGGGGGKGGKGKGKKGKGKSRASPEPEDKEVDQVGDILTVMTLSGEYPDIAASSASKEVRPYIVFCYVVNVDLCGDNLKQFISLQTKLHKSVCDNRNVATIATHDFSKVVGPLEYTAREPGDLSITPLSSSSPVKADRLVDNLKNEAEALRKEKKRSQVSGLHHYLHLLDSWSVYPCLTDSGGERVISFPPVTNSGDTKISQDTKTLLVEVTSSGKLADCKLVLDTLLREMVPLQGGKLQVVQGRVVGEEGELKVTYPSKTDLVDLAGVTVVRE